MLQNVRDIQSVSYLLLAPGLAAWQWIYGLSWPLYGLMLVIWIATGIVNHNHAHRPMWKNGLLNRTTELVGSVIQGHPVYVFPISHNDNHHRYNHGPEDIARTYRFNGDHNHLLGHIFHPLQVLFVLYPFFFSYIKTVKQQNRRAFIRICSEYALVAGSWLFLLYLNPVKTLVFVLIPQLVCLHWLLGANYLQHAHANGLSQWNFARNFTGAINWVFLNVGFHTAHHKYPKVHWSKLPELHRKIAAEIDPRLNEPSFFWYVLRTYILSIFKPSFRSRSLMPATEVP